MSVVIVTKKCYLICERIINMTLHEGVLETNTKTYPLWNINIEYEAVPNAGSSGGKDTDSVNITIGDQKAAYILFTEIVSQIREQTPDQLYLDKLAERYLTGGPLTENTLEYYQEQDITKKGRKKSGPRKSFKGRSHFGAKSKRKMW